MEANKNIANVKDDNKQGSLPYEHCLNCGEKLQGRYCHNCGQKVVSKTPTIRGFVFAYFENAFMWDSQFLKTLWTLLRRPGQLTKDYNAGKFISQEHPLKLNMFLLFVFVSLFFFFSSPEKITSSGHSLTSDERLFSGLQLQLMANDSLLTKKMQESPRDTVFLHAPLYLAEEYSHIISNIGTKEDTKGEGIDQWIAIVPRTLIEEKIIVQDKVNGYRFNTEAKHGKEGAAWVRTIWEEMVRITSHYFPILLLLTTPFLAFSLCLVQRKSKLPPINHFIFALHYTAFLEFTIICIYVLYLLVAPPMNLLQYALTIGSCVYLAFAYRKVYATSWVKAAIKSLLTSFIYFSMILFVFWVIFLVACGILIAKIV